MIFTDYVIFEKTGLEYIKHLSRFWHIYVHIIT